MRDVTLNPDVAFICLHALSDELKRLHADKNAESRDFSLIAGNITKLRLALMKSAEDDDEITRVLNIADPLWGKPP